MPNLRSDAHHSAIQAEVVIPAPLHRVRLRERGYNQAELIARPPSKTKNRLLFAHAYEAASCAFGVSRKEHWDSVAGAYATREGVQVDNLRVLLLDDVLTTGATLDSCSRALKKAGAKAVLGLTVARVLTGLPPLNAAPVTG
jgi:competence protein ComFC